MKSMSLAVVAFGFFVTGMSVSMHTVNAASRPLQERPNDGKQLDRPIADQASESAFFEKGVLLKAAGKPIKTKWFGHASPALLDLDKDGDLDLLVGQYEDGNVAVYENSGSDAKPSYAANGKLMAGGEVASVSTFCCVGFTPCIVDFDGDGIDDILSGSYPGELHIFRGNKDGTFEAREDIKGTDGKSLKPGRATTAHAVDLDGDGDLDLLSSLKKGGVAVCFNKGNRTGYSFGEWEQVLVEGEPIPYAHAGPVVFDFDQDGLNDLIVASEEMTKPDTWRSRLICYRNTAKSGKPVYAKPHVILEGHVGLRLKIWPVDYDRDGHEDLLVGDMFADCPQDGYTGYVWFYRRKPKSGETLPSEVPGTSKNSGSAGSQKSTKDSRGEKVTFEISDRNEGSDRYLLVSLAIAEHWHIYGDKSEESIRTCIELPSIDGVKFSDPIYPEPKKVNVFGDMTLQFHDEFEIKIPYQIDQQEFDGTKSEAELKFKYQVCGDAKVGGVCLPGKTKSLSFDLGGD